MLLRPNMPPILEQRTVIGGYFNRTLSAKDCVRRPANPLERFVKWPWVR